MMKRMAIFALLLSITLLGSGAEATAQQPSPKAPYLATPEPPGTIEGSERPDQISTHTAFRLFMRFLAGATQTHARASLATAGLNDSEIGRVLAFAGDFDSRVTILESRIANTQVTTPAGAMDLARLRANKETLVAEGMRSLRLQFGSITATRLLQGSLTSVRANTKIARLCSHDEEPQGLCEEPPPDDPPPDNPPPDDPPPNEPPPDDPPPDEAPPDDAPPDEPPPDDPPPDDPPPGDPPPDATFEFVVGGQPGQPSTSDDFDSSAASEGDLFIPVSCWGRVTGSRTLHFHGYT